MPLVSELQRLEQEGHKFDDSLTGMNMFERERQKRGLVLSVVAHSVDCSNGNELNFSDSSCFSDLSAAVVLLTTDCRDFFFKICECLPACLCAVCMQYHQRSEEGI